MIASLLTACGGGGSSNSSSGFAPVSANAFETRFVNRNLVDTSEGTIAIVPEKRISITDGSAVVTIPYVYINTGANTGTLTFTVGTLTCTWVYTFTSNFAGNINETCSDGTSGTSTFVFGDRN